MLAYLVDFCLIVLSCILVFVLPVIRLVIKLVKAMHKEQDRIYWIMANEIIKRSNIDS